MNLLKGSLQDELDLFFKSSNSQEFDKRIVSKAAFCKARQNLSHSTFVELNTLLIHDFYNGVEYKKWKGFRLNAVDGSTLKLPCNENMVNHFGRQTRNEVPQARISSRYDVLNEITIELLVEPIYADERKMAQKHLETTDHTDLLLYDRGYPCFSLFSAHRKSKSNFVMRLAKKFSRETIEFENSNLKEKIITLEARRPETKLRCVKSGVATEPMDIRLIKIMLPKGEIEILATTLLDADLYPYEDFSGLYHLRWSIEEDYKTKKVWLEYENFSGKSVESVFQDIYAKLFVQNVASLIAWVSNPIIQERYKHRKLKYKINKAQVISKMKNCFIRLASRKVGKLVQALIDLFIRTVEAVRPNRSVERNKKFRQRHFYPQYKTVR